VTAIVRITGPPSNKKVKQENVVLGSWLTIGKTAVEETKCLQEGLVRLGRHCVSEKSQDRPQLVLGSRVRHFQRCV
jgi:hypothetical protein